MWIWLSLEWKSRSRRWRGLPPRTSSWAKSLFFDFTFCFRHKLFAACVECVRRQWFGSGESSLWCLLSCLPSFLSSRRRVSGWELRELSAMSPPLFLCFSSSMFGAVTNPPFGLVVLRPHTLIKLLSITQHDEVKPECFCKFTLKREKSKHLWQQFESPVFLV